MMPLISGGIVSEPADVSGRKSSTEGQTFALKPKHTPVTTALIDELSGKLVVVVVHHDATPTVHLKCSVRPLRYPICASCHLHPCSRNAEAFQGGEKCPTVVDGQ